MKVTLIALTTLLLAAPMWAEANHPARFHSHERPLISVSGTLYRQASPPFNYERHGDRDSRQSPLRSRDYLAVWYARTAVAQSRKAWRYGCARSHPRWSTSYREHHRWALRQNLARVEREIERRERTLASCLAR